MTLVNIKANKCNIGRRYPFLIIISQHFYDETNHEYFLWHKTDDLSQANFLRSSIAQ